MSLSDTKEQHERKECSGPMFCSFCHAEFLARPDIAKGGDVNFLMAENAKLAERVKELETQLAATNKGLEREVRSNDVVRKSYLARAEAAERVCLLVEDPHPGLLTWNEALARCLAAWRSAREGK